MIEEKELILFIAYLKEKNLETRNEYLKANLFLDNSNNASKHRSFAYYKGALWALQIIGVIKE